MAVCVAPALYLDDDGADLRDAHRNYHPEENVNLLSFFRAAHVQRVVSRREDIVAHQETAVGGISKNWKLSDGKHTIGDDNLAVEKYESNNARLILK